MQNKLQTILLLWKRHKHDHICFILAAAIHLHFFKFRQQLRTLRLHSNIFRECRALDQLSFWGSTHVPWPLFGFSFENWKSMLPLTPSASPRNLYFLELILIPYHNCFISNNRVCPNRHNPFSGHRVYLNHFRLLVSKQYIYRVLTPVGWRTST